MILGILPEQGGSIANLARTGQDVRFVRSYLGHYARAFDEVYYFSYADEHPAVPENCHVIPNPGTHRWTYAFTLPFIQREHVRKCHVFRVMQAYGAIPAIVARLLYGIPYVATYGYPYFRNVRAEGMGLPRAVLLSCRARLGARLADRVIVTTDQMAAQVARFVPQRRLLTIPNGVDTDLFRPARERPCHGRRTIVYVGRLSPEKNLFTLVDAAASIREAELVLVGDGELRAALETRAREQGVRISWAGVVPHHHLPAILQDADVFVLPSLSEGHPKALLEAMSCGLPCVGTDVPGIRDVIRDHENGLLCGLTKEDLAHQLNLVLSDPALGARLGQQARAFVVENFDLDRLLARETSAMRSLAR